MESKVVIKEKDLQNVKHNTAFEIAIKEERVHGASKRILFFNRAIVKKSIKEVTRINPRSIIRNEVV